MAAQILNTKHIGLLLVVFFSSACALLGSGDDDPGTKNKIVDIRAPAAPFARVTVGTADEVWQSNATGNTIAVNSLCRKYQDLSLERLKANILAGVEDLKIEKSEKTTFDGREAERVSVSGKTDGVPISVDLMIYKKNNCTYDLAYISTRDNHSKELQIFEKFLEGFHVP